jgi:hypothetical protein
VVQYIEETEIFNAYEYFGGLRGMIDLAKRGLHNEMIMKGVGNTEKSLIETAIIMIQNEMMKLNALFDGQPQQQQQQPQPQQEEEDEAKEEEEAKEEDEAKQEEDEEAKEEDEVKEEEVPKQEYEEPAVVTHPYFLRPRKRRIEEI